MVASSFTPRPLYTLQHEVVSVKYIYRLVNSLYIYVRLPQSGEFLCDLFLKHFPTNPCSSVRSNGVCPPPPFIPVLEGTEPQENDQGVGSELFADGVRKTRWI